MIVDFKVHFRNRAGDARSIDLRLDSQDFVQNDIAVAIYKGQFYEHELSLFMAMVLDDGDVAFDVGVNAGYFTALMGKLVGPSGLVVGFEPNPRLWELATHHATVNGVTLDLRRIGVCDSAGSVWFRDNGPDDTNGAFAHAGDNPEQTARRFAVQTDTLDNVVLGNGGAGLAGRLPKLIKLDIEGAEMAALKGAHRLLCAGALEFVSCEINGPQLHLFGTSAVEIRRLMLGYGFDTYLLDADGGMPRFVPPNVDIRASYVTNVLFARTACLAKYWPSVTVVPAAARLLETMR